VGLIVAAAALASALPAAAALQPIRRSFGETTLTRVRAGTIRIPAGHESARVRLIVGLHLPPLAAAHGRAVSAANAGRKLDVAGETSRRYLARVVAAQRRAVVQLRRAIPQARVEERFQVVLDALTVDLPVSKLPMLVRLGLVAKVYPTLRYTLDTNRSPGVIGADVLHQATGARGEGIKIGIVDDGVDPTNPFFNPSSFSYPAGFPKGLPAWTSPKVIAARVFPGPTSGNGGRLAVDPTASFHGTHVAGIAAGDAGTCSPGGSDHPPTCGLSGVAPRAYLANYRVFTVPTPVGYVANTPEIVAAFESAVRDGMDVINFSGGGPATEPANDALLVAVHNVAAAGVVPVIAAGNDRDSFGLGTVGSPGSAPDAITVGAVSNTHVFDATLSVRAQDAPAAVEEIPIASAGGEPFPSSFARESRLLVDVGTLTTQGGAPVDRLLCGPGDDPNDETKSPLAPGSLRGAVALVSRGHCTFASKAIRAASAGAVAIVLVDNRTGEADPIPIRLQIPGGKISDLDGAELRSYLDARGGSAPVTVGSTIEQVETGRSGIVTDFSSAGLTSFDDLLKPDVAAPGGQILSSTLPSFTGGAPFAVFDGTSMAAPQVTGAAALLLQLHGTWTPQQVKSALVSTAGPAWADTARTKEAPVILEGGGLIDVQRADDPKLFTDPASLSFGKLDVTRSAADQALLVRVADSGGGAGTWAVGLVPQATTAGAALELPPLVTVPPGGEGELVATARAATGAAPGWNYGFIVLRRGDLTRRVPYAFDISRPALAGVDAQKLKAFNLGDTLDGPNRVSVYCCPSAPFGPPPDYVGAPMDETGTETLYVTSVERPLVNVGVSVVDASVNSLIDPWFLGSKDERDVQGYAGTPVNQNDLMIDFAADIGAAGAAFPRQKQYYVSVDSGSDPFTHAPLAGRYRLRSWQNDLRPPTARVLTVRVAAGRPTIVARVLDAKSGVDPFSLTIAYRSALVGAAAYDSVSGLAVFPLPGEAPPIPNGKTRLVLSASDFQEAKNLETIGNDIMPNTAFRAVTLRGVAGPAMTWLAPRANQCVAGKTATLDVVAGSSRRVTSVRFLADGHQVALSRRGTAGLFSASWRIGKTAKGRHVLVAVATDAAGKRLSAVRPVRVCR
jgi:minor extracellular serine protease Vpr